MRLSNLTISALVAGIITAEELLYRNTFNSPTSISTWIPEGPLTANISNNTLTLSGAGSPTDNFVLWLPDLFPSRIRISWSFRPIQEPGLAMILFGATSLSGGSIFDPHLRPRNGSYPQYHSSDIRLLHASYFRRKLAEERRFHVANLRKSPGFHLVAQGADPIPDVVDTSGAFYNITVVKDGFETSFSIDGLQIFRFVDDGRRNDTGVPVLGEAGRIGFRGMQPLVAGYRDLEVWALD